MWPVLTVDYPAVPADLFFFFFKLPVQFAKSLVGFHSTLREVTALPQMTDSFVVREGCLLFLLFKIQIKRNNSKIINNTFC